VALELSHVRIRCGSTCIVKWNCENVALIYLSAESQLVQHGVVPVSDRQTRIQQLQVMCQFKSIFIYTHFEQGFLPTISISDCHRLITEAYCHPGGIALIMAHMNPQQQPPDNPQSTPDWCIRGKCREMPTVRENVCCRKRPCLSTTDLFSLLVLQTDVLSVAIIHHADQMQSIPLLVIGKLHIGSGRCGKSGS